MAELLVIEKEKLEIFQKDTEKLGQSTSDFITSFYPYYGVNNELAVKTPQENSKTRELLRKTPLFFAQRRKAPNLPLR